MRTDGMSYEVVIILLHACAVLEPLICEHGPAHKLLPLVTDSAFHALANVVISQQLSIHSAKAISDRVAAAAGVCVRFVMHPFMCRVGPARDPATCA